jgi:hypothetical protein
VPQLHRIFGSYACLGTNRGQAQGTVKGQLAWTPKPPFACRRRSSARVGDGTQADKRGLAPQSVFRHSPVYDESHESQLKMSLTGCECA